MSHERTTHQEPRTKDLEPGTKNREREESTARYTRPMFKRGVVIVLAVIVDHYRHRLTRRRA